MLMSTSDIFTILSVGLLILQGGYFFLYYKSSISRLISLNFFLIAIHFLAKLGQQLVFEPMLLELLQRFSSLIPGVVWITAFSLFSDEEEISPYFWLLFVGYFLLASIASFQSMGLFPASEAQGQLVYFLFNPLPFMIMLCLAVHAVLIAIRSYNMDLIEARRKVRLYFVAGGASLVFLTVLPHAITKLANTLSLNELPWILPAIDFFLPLYAFSILLVFSLASYKMQGQIQLTVEGTNHLPRSITEINQRKVDEVESALVAKIINCMEEDKLYLDGGFTITEFSTKLGINEHKLRRVINKRLSYKNFNQFINSFRVRDAKHQLLELPSPISSIAFEVGFSSLSAFNKSFKDLTGQTPTSFRLSHYSVKEECLDFAGFEPSLKD